MLLQGDCGFVGVEKEGLFVMGVLVEAVVQQFLLYGLPIGSVHLLISIIMEYCEREIPGCWASVKSRFRRKFWKN